MLLGTEREVYCITFIGVIEGIDIAERCTCGYLGEHRTVVGNHLGSLEIGLSVGYAGLVNGKVLIQNVVKGLRVNSLCGPVDTESLEVESEIEAQVLGELEVLVINIDCLIA